MNYFQESGEDKHDKKTRLTMFGALSHGYTDDMKVVLGLPDLPTSTDKYVHFNSFIYFVIHLFVHSCIY